MNPQHGLDCEWRAPAKRLMRTACIGLDQAQQRRLRNHSFHLFEEDRLARLLQQRVKAQHVLFHSSIISALQPSRHSKLCWSFCRPSLTAAELAESGFIAGHLLLICDVTLRQETENRLKMALETQGVQIADNLRLQTELHGEARIDALRGAYNRRSMEETLPNLVDQALHLQRPLSLAMIDLEHFKAINDEHGHVFGDSVLKAFAGHFLLCREKTIVFIE